ncbi:MAG: cation-transporting P-type ATPase [Bacteroidota bacterium]|nr:cation-transporting P-type ATPase [Candidatus Kapabacteria bacterium]MDW8219912.1 cation-transporting P-type ATPase [Bacteroidota bacterium]
MTPHTIRSAYDTSSVISGTFHTQSIEELYAAFAVDPALGLNHHEVEKRRAQYGYNILTPPKRQPAWFRFLVQFHQPLVYILLASAAITVALGEWIDASVIFAVVLVNSLIGFLQENKAIQAIDALLHSMKTTATVRRHGEKVLIDAIDLVPGDIVLLASGDKVPADIRIIHARDVQADESALTGESVPVAKSPHVLPNDTPLADRTNMLYASSSVTYGSCTGLVVATGNATEVGAISHMLTTTTKIETPLTRKLKSFSSALLYVIVSVATLTFALGIWQGRPALDMFLAAVSLMVGMIPEGLPATITIMLAIGVHAMAQRNAIIRKLPAVETLGSVTVVCSDKTGTLTENQMTVQQVNAAGIVFTVSGLGYTPQGHITRASSSASSLDSSFLAQHQALEEVLRIGVLCNDSILTEDTQGRWSIKGDPTEGALLVVAHKASMTRLHMEEQFPRLDTIPFESAYQYMATLHRAPSGECVIYVKGSLEALSERCSTMLREIDGVVQEIPFDRDTVATDTEQLASQGLRTLAFARKRVAGDILEISHRDVLSGLTFVGIQGMIDPPREEVKGAIQQCHEAGISVKMITGDHATTASVIARQIGLRGATRQDNSLLAITGAEIARMSEEELFEQARHVAVFARVSPEQKLRIVEALQHHNHIVAMTGDGVNDAPALRKADVGIAMGISGTDVAKDAADIVLADDNFVSIEAAIEEGRTVFGNLMKFIVWTIPTNLGEGMIVFLSIMLMSSLPMLPIHVLWINMSTALCLGLMLAFEPKEPDVMKRPPRRPDKPLLTLPLVMRTLFVGTMMFAAGYGIFHWHLQHGSSEALARTATMTVFILIETLYLFNCRSLVYPLQHVGYWSNRWIFVGVGMMLLLQTIIIHVPLMNRLFHTQPLSLQDWLIALAISCVVYGAVAVEKRLRLRAMHRRHSS